MKASWHPTTREQAKAKGDALLLVAIDTAYCNGVKIRGKSMVEIACPVADAWEVFELAMQLYRQRKAEREAEKYTVL